MVEMGWAKTHHELYNEQKIINFDAIIVCLNM